MTPPDSGDYLRARTIRNVENPMKPDSAEREVRGAQMDAAGGPRCWCGKLSAYPSGWCGQCTEPEVPGHEIPEVSLPLSLAQRILFVVDRAADGLRVDVAELRAIRAELRAAVERKGAP